MASYNRVILLGNVCRDPELRYTPNKGTPLLDLSLGVNRSWTDDGGVRREETTFVDITLWSRLAEIAGQYLRKGSPVFIEGHLQLDSWEDKQTGQKRSKLRVVGETMQLLGSKEGGARPATSQQPAALSQRRATAVPTPKPYPHPIWISRSRMKPGSHGE